MPTDTMAIYLRWMVLRDMPDVMRIEEACFGWDAWTKEDYLRCLGDRLGVGMVAEDRTLSGEYETGLTLGFMVYELRETRLHILNLAVDPAHQRRGVGSSMIANLIARLSNFRRRTKLTVNVRERNLEGQLFFRALGFQAARVLAGFYENTGEDAYRMVYRRKEGE